MKKLILALSLLASACTGNQSADDASSARLILADHNCAALTTEAACDADKQDGCQWELTAIPAIACPANENCPTPVQTGVCVGNPGTDPCAIVDQCSNVKDENTCGVLANCAWEPAACPAIVLADGGTPACEPYVCAPVNPCASLDAKTCESNPACELVTSTSGCAEPAIACAKGENCPPPPTCPPPVTTTICEHKTIECIGTSGSGNGGGTTGSGNGTSTSSGGTSTGGTSTGSSGGTSTGSNGGTAQPG